MKIVKFLGGLGNQMFQYAFYLSVKQQFGKVKADVISFENYEFHNGFELERVFGIHLDYASPFEVNLYTSDNREWIWRKLRRLYGTKNVYYQEKLEFFFDDSIYLDMHKRYYWGYWQHIQYVKLVETELREHFSFSKISDPQNEILKAKIKSNNSVSVHVRRGDYLGHSILGGICDANYYKKALNLIQEKIEEPLFVFFSNDIDWCKDNFKNENAIFVDWNQGERSFIDMELMSFCKHNVIANSSFSWWGAWLNNSPEKIVISPSRWTNDGDVDVSGILMPEFVKI